MQPRFKKRKFIGFVLLKMEKLRISAVSYLNTFPFIYGIERSGALKNYYLEIDSPAICGEKLVSGKADIALAPVAILPNLPFYEILTDYCIGCHGAVKSVMLFSDVSLAKIKNIYLDYNSKTSVFLLKLLSKKFWNINPEFIEAPVDYEMNIKGTTAGLVIGDRCFEMNNRYKYQYDLGEEWQKFTGLPFVFACWITVKKLSEEQKNLFNQAILYGMKKKEDFVTELALEPVNGVDMEEYLLKNISYEFDKNKKQALDLFLSSVFSNSKA